MGWPKRVQAEHGPWPRSGLSLGFPKKKNQALKPGPRLRKSFQVRLR